MFKRKKKMAKINLVKGNFVWKDGIVNSTVIFVPCENGKFLCAWIPEKNKI